MSNFGFYSEKSSITFESHLEGLQEKTRGLLLESTWIYEISRRQRY